MKLHLPKMLAVALLAAMSMSPANAISIHVTPTDSITSGALTSDTADVSSSTIITKVGEGTVEVTGTVTKYAALYVHEGDIKVGDGTTATTLTIDPFDAREGSLMIGGKDAEVTFNKATFINGSQAFRGVGTADGSGSLNLTNGSQMVSGNCEKFTIGTGVYAGSSGYTEGIYHDASNGSGKKFGRGDVTVSGGSSLMATYRSFYMGEGSLNVHGEDDSKISKVQIGNDSSGSESYRGYRAILGIEEDSTSEINVGQYAEVSVYAFKEFTTNYADNSTTKIKVDGTEANFVVGKVEDSYTSSYIGGTAKNALTTIEVANGGNAEFCADRTVFGDNSAVENNAVTSISVDKDSKLSVNSTSGSMYDGTSINNSGQLSLQTTYTYYIYGGKIENEQGATLKFDEMKTYSISDPVTGKSPETLIVNKGTMTATSYELTGGKVINQGTMEGYVTASGASTLINSGVRSGTTWVSGSEAVVQTTDGSEMGKTFLTKGSLVVDGRVKMNGSLEAYATDEGDAQLVFTEDGHLDMSGNSVQLGAVTLVLQKDGHVGQMTSVDDVDFFSNYSSSDVTDETVVVVVGSDGSTSVRQLGNMNYGTFLGGSRNQRAFYNALEAMVATGDAPQWAEALSNTQDAEALEAGIDALSGHEYATAMSSQIEGNMGHLRRLRGAMGKGTALGSYVVSPGSKGSVDEKGNEVMAATPAVTDVRNWRVGVSAFHEETEIDSDARGDGYDRSETGAMLTAEYYMNKDLTLGGALSYGRTNLRTDAAKRRHEDNTRFDVYALYGKKRWSFATSLGLGLHDHELERELADTKVDGYSVNFMQDAAYTVLSCDDSNVQVFGTVESSWNEIDSFSDGMISGASQDAWSTDVTVGLRYNHALPALGNAPAGVFSAQTGVTASIGDIKSGVDMNINGYGYRQESATRNRWGWNLGAGVDVPVRTNMSVYGAVDAVMRGDSNSVDGQVGVKVSF